MTHLRKLSVAAESSREQPLKLLAVTAIEDALPAFGAATHLALWVELQSLLGKHLSINARDSASKHDDTAMLERAASAYRQAQQKAATLKREPGEDTKLQLDHAHVLIRLGQSGDATSAAEAETLLTAAARNFPPDASAQTRANVQLNMARAAETQGDCATGAARRAHYLRARGLYQNALAFWEASKLDKLQRARKNLERLDGKLRQM
jgi:hypothetical protein